MRSECPRATLLFVSLKGTSGKSVMSPSASIIHALRPRIVRPFSPRSSRHFRNSGNTCSLPRSFSTRFAWSRVHCFRRLQLIEQFRNGRIHQLWLLDQLAILRGARQMRPCVLVAARVAEVDFAVLNDRVVPVGDVDAPSGPIFTSMGRKATWFALDHFRHLRGWRSRCRYRRRA